MPQVLSERPVGIKKGGRFIAEAVCRPGLITDLRLERLALLGLLAGLAKAFELFFPHCCSGEAIFCFPVDLCAFYSNPYPRPRRRDRRCPRYGRRSLRPRTLRAGVETIPGVASALRVDPLCDL